MISANQLYKQSGSDKPFKVWLKENQDKGVLDNHEKMYNANGDEEEDNEESTSSTTPTKTPTKKAPTTHQAKQKMGMLNIVGLVGVGLLLYGLTRASAE
jgi:hypothetical protein